MNIVEMYVLVILGAPVVWVTGLGVMHCARRIQANACGRKPVGEYSVTAITARIEAERASAAPVKLGQEAKAWPVAGHVPAVNRARDELVLQTQRPGIQVQASDNDEPTEVVPRI